jgi:hypothetical protein
MMKKYKYVKVDIQRVNAVLEEHLGWEVFFFNRNTNASSVDILFVIDVDK